MSQPSVTVIIVTYHSLANIGECLDALRSSIDVGDTTCVVVDNASADRTADFVADTYPWVKLVRSAENLGYGRGCNLGFEHCTTPYILILNPDAVADRHTIVTLREFMNSHPAAGMAAPALLEGGHYVQAAGLMTTPGSLFRSAIGSRRVFPDQRVIEPGAPPFETTWICGAAMMIRSDLFKSLGGFDPRFFLYFEETDLCRRANATGASIWAVGRARITHVGGASAQTTGESRVNSCIAEHYYRSRYYYMTKHFGWTLATLSELADASASFARALRDKFRTVPSRHGSVRRPLLQFPSQPQHRA